MSPSSLTRFSGRRSDRFVINLQSKGVWLSAAHALALGWQGPCDAGVLVGDGDQGTVIAAALLQLERPARDAVLMRAGDLQHRAGALDQQVSKVGVAALADVAKARFATGGMLSGHQADPGGELPPVLELACIPDGGDDRQRRGRADASDLHQAPCRLREPCLRFDL